MTIDPIAHTGSGLPAGAVQPLDPAKFTPGTGLTHDDKMTWAAPLDDAEADAMSLHALLRSLPSARAYDSGAYHRMVNAIHRRGNPECWHAALRIEEDSSYLGVDWIEVAMEGARGVKMKAQRGGTGDHLWLSWHLYDLFDPHDVESGSEIKVTIARQGETAQQRTWVFPWGQTDYKSHKFSGDADYRMSMQLA
jgi:hypothetical protein